MAFPVPAETKSITGRDGTLTVAAFSSLAVGNLMVATVAVATNTPTSITPPSGWTQTHADATGNLCMAFFTKTAVSGDVGSTFTFTWSFGASNQDVGSAAIVRITGIDPTTPILASTYNDGGATTTPTGTAINPSKNVLFLQMLPYTITSGQTPSVGGYAIANNNPSWTEHADLASVTATNSATAGVAVATANQGALGTTGTASATLSTSSTDYSFGFIGVQAPAITPVLAGSLFGILSFIVNSNFVAGLAGSLFGAFTAIVTTTTNWTRQQKDTDSWTKQNKS